MNEDTFIITNGTVTYRGKPVPGSDATTLTQLPGEPRFWRDSHQCYATSTSKEGLCIIPDADPASFIACDATYTVDADYVFHHDFHQVTMNPQARRNTDILWYKNKPESLSAFLSREHGSVIGWWHKDYPHHYRAKKYVPGYGEEGGNVYFICNRDAFNAALTHPLKPDKDSVFDYVLVRGVDTNSFAPLDYLHARDANHAYFRWQRIAGADAQSFTAMGYGFARDASHIYYNGVRVEDADAASFAIVQDSKTARYLGDNENGYTHVARDKNGFFDLKQKRLPYAEYRQLAMREGSKPKRGK